MAQGGPSSEQMQKACAQIAAKHLTATDIDSMASAMGLSGEQVAQLKGCAQGGGVPASASAAKPKAPAPPSAPVASAESSAFSPIERSFRDLARPYARVSNPSPATLTQFGYSLFSAPVSTFAPVTNVPVSSDYILGPGDELNVLLWGRVNQTLHLKVERDGAVQMPQIGPFQVAGLTFGQAKKLIESRAGQITGVQVNVTMGQIRTIQVFVIGKVNKPGLYTVSALSHVSNALGAAGGISKIGSLRDISLRRGNQTVEVIDIYRMLLHGDTSADVRLEAQDVIFVPVIGSVVGVSGDVKSPAIYELKGSEELKTVLKMAGGVSAFGYSRRVQVERIDNHQRRIALDLGLEKLDAQRFRIRDGDLIEVFTVLPQQQNVVTLKGNVRRPGAYQWRPGMTVDDLILEGEGVADRTFFDYALVRRLEGPTREVHLLPVNLGAALRNHSAGSVNLALAPRDELTVYSDKDIQDLPNVTIRGAVRKPGTYPLSAGMKISDLIYEATGLKDDAYWARAQLARTKVVNGARTRFTYVDVDLRSVLGPGGMGDLALQRGDELFIQQASNWHQPWGVTVKGEVLRPGPYVISENERLATVLRECGGLRANAYPPAIVFVRQSVKTLQQERLNESRLRLKQEAARLSLQPAQPGQKQGDMTGSVAMLQQVLASSEAQQAVGRVVLHVTSLAALDHSADNVVLENGDQIVVPQRPAAVNVLGQVYNPTAIIYEPGLMVRDYLQKAGGPTEGADEDHIFVSQANGSILTDVGLRNSNKNALFPLLPAIGGGLMESRLGPGDTVYVPEKLIFVSGFQYATDITQIIANSVMSLGTIGILATVI